MGRLYNGEADRKAVQRIWLESGWIEDEKKQLDIEKAISALHFETESLAFNLTITDPVERYLDTDSPWRGCSGEYTVTLEETSHCAPG